MRTREENLAIARWLASKVPGLKANRYLTFSVADYLIACNPHKTNIQLMSEFWGISEKDLWALIDRSESGPNANRFARGYDRLERARKQLTSQSTIKKLVA